MVVIHIIHDKERTDRYELLMKEQQQQGFEIHFWDAVKEFPKPRVNINAAHKKVVQYAKDNKMPEIIIGEDDMMWLGEGAFDKFIENKPTDFDLYLSSVMHGRIEQNQIQDFSGLQCYIVHERFYDSFLSADPNKDIDRALTRMGKFVVANPFYCIQHETMSDNQKKIHRNEKIYRGRNLYNG